MFAIVLGHMERNGQLRLFSEEGNREMWLYLFGKSFADMNVMTMAAARQVR